jgi:hypothetical protein
VAVSVPEEVVSYECQYQGSTKKESAMARTAQEAAATGRASIEDHETILLASCELKCVPQTKHLENLSFMRFLLLPLLLILSFQAFGADPVLKFTLTKADGTPAAYEFFVPNDNTDQSLTMSQDEAVQRQHNAGVAALTWAKQFYGAHEIYLRSVELQNGPVPYYLAKFDGDLAGARQVFFAIVLTSGSILEPTETLQGTTSIRR